MTPYEELDELYATLPTVQCQRKCGEYCCGILIPKIEAQRLEEKKGWLQFERRFQPNISKHLPAPEILQKEFIGLRGDDFHACVFLVPRPTPFCSAYAVRPLVCRMWGCVDHEKMRCPHGCVPTRWVSQEEFKELIMKVIQIQRRHQNEQPTSTGTR